MQSFFCADASRKAEESLIGWAVPSPLYVLIEYPQPWSANLKDFQVDFQGLTQIREEFHLPENGIRTIFIYNQQLQTDYQRVILLEQEKGFSCGYRKTEFHLDHLTALIPTLREYFSHSQPSQAQKDLIQTRDILICTHGSYDKCCGKYGKPFYREAVKILQELQLENQIRVWQASHFGGHRFAPTAIDFPEGRYYGRLDPDSFRAILTRQGEIQQLQKVYRGWGILPSFVQMLEQELMQLYGWEWFNYAVNFAEVEVNEAETFCRCQLQVKITDDCQKTYQAEIVEDLEQSISLKGGCQTLKAEKYPQFKIQNIALL